MSDDGADDDRKPPPVSRLNRPTGRRYRTLSRTNARSAHRRRRRTPIAELIGELVASHGLTDEVRRQIVFVYWHEIAGERFAARTAPTAIVDGVLQASATSSAWVHEMQFYKAALIQRINAWAEAHRTWLGPGTLVTDIRFALGSVRREPYVDPDQVRRLFARQLRRLRPRPIAPPPTVTDEERAAIEAETSCIVDDELRATIERVRTRWSR